MAALTSGGDVLLAGKSIDITNALDVTDTTQTSKSSSFGLSIGASSQLLQSGGNLVDAAKIASTSDNDRVTAVAGLAGGMAAVVAVPTLPPQLSKTGMSAALMRRWPK